MRTRRVAMPALALLAGLALAVPVVAVEPSISPATVEAIVFPGASVTVEKTVQTPEIPPKVDVCLLEDETGSFGDDIANLKNPTTIAAIFDGVRAGAPDSQFAVAGFRDYPTSPYGSPGDWVYRLLSTMSPDFAAWSAGVNLLTAGGGADNPEAQYDAIVASVLGGFGYADCGWRDVDGVTRVLVVATDNAFHLPGTGKPHVNDAASTVAVLDTSDVVVVGLKAPGAGVELDYLAAQTGGSVQAISSDGANIAAAILAGLAAVEVDVTMASDCEWPIATTFDPALLTVTSGSAAVFTETIAVAADAPGGTYTCKDWAKINDVPLADVAGAVLYETKTIKVPEGFLTGGGQIIEGSGKNAAKISFAGNVGFLADFTLVGQYQITFHNVKGTTLDGGKFHSTAITGLQFDVVCGTDAYPPPANANRAIFTAAGRFNGVDGWTVEVRAADFGEPGKDNDSIRVILTSPSGSVYDSYMSADFPDNDNQPGCGVDDSVRHLLDSGNLQIHPGPKG
jgi:hypothetical protein